MQNPKENIQTVNSKKKTAKKRKNKFNLKSYIRDFLLFVFNRLFKSTGILVVIAVLLIAMSIGPMVSAIDISECDGLCTDSIVLWGDYTQRLQILLIILVSGIVPYIYAPVIGYVGYLMAEISNIAYIIKDYGALAGIGASIIPLIINVIIISIVTALGIYMCRTITVGYKISSVKNMNYTNFRIKLYEVLNKQDRVEALTNKKNEKINKLTAKKEKLAYIQILNIAIAVCVLQFISVLIQHMFI